MTLNTEKFKYVGLNNIEQLPNTTGIYAFKKDAVFLYIGKALNIKNRVKNHVQQPVFKDTVFIPQTKKIGFIATNSEIEALILEASLIKKYQPKYNKQWKDGKNYYFVAITEEAFPRVFMTHQKAQTNNKKLITNNGGKLLVIRPMLFVSMGPFIDGGALKQTLRILRKIFLFRTCNKLPRKACLYKGLNLCLAPCEGKNQESGIRNYEKEYKRNIKNLMAILNGKKNMVIKNLQKEMAISSKQQDFEKAKTIRDQIFALENVFSHSHFFKKETPVEATEWLRGTKPLGGFDSLQEVLGLKNAIKRIEGYDVSNIQGQQATGSMVVFENGKPNKKEYKKFKIKIENKPNDTAMLKEVLERRLKHLEWPAQSPTGNEAGWAMPQVMLIDGGIGQINIALKLKMKNEKLKNTKIISLAKRNNKLFIEGKDKPILLKNLPQEVSNLILQIRDEAHRFAITYHKTLRSKNFIK